MKLYRSQAGRPPTPDMAAMGVSAPAVGLWRFYQQGQQVRAVDHTFRNEGMLIGSGASTRGVGKQTPWGTGGVNFSGTTGFSVATKSINTNLATPGDTVGNGKGFTVWAWVMADPADAASTIRFVGKGAGWNFRFHTNNTTTSFAVPYSVSGSAASSTSSPVNRWRFVCGTFFDRQTNLYVDGVLVVSNGRSGGLVADTGNLTIGGDGTTGAATAIDHIGIDNRIYQPQEIRDLYLNPFKMFPRPRLYLPKFGADVVSQPPRNIFIVT